MDSTAQVPRWIFVAIGLLLGIGYAPVTGAVFHLSHSSTNRTDEPITPVPEPQPVDPMKAALGERLFGDVRLSRENTRKCSSCHDLATNGASKNVQDTTPDGSRLPLNTPTIFNAALSFRLGWKGEFRTLESQAAAILQNPRIMGTRTEEVVEKLRRDSVLVRQFKAAYGRGPDEQSVLDALATFERSLITPDSRFDRWLRGDTAALSAQEMDGYRLFKSLGCSSCHQGVNVGGNLFERHGIFHQLTATEPAIVRVPSLRNIATSAPYFHDGSVLTLEQAVRKMAEAQLNSKLNDQQVADITAYLRTLTGIYRGQPLVEPR
jgi:cytochrome c peroxidase